MQSNIYFPIVTIVSPCFNHELYVIESLDSIRNQTYQYIEHIIIDDCSTDNSVNVSFVVLSYILMDKFGMIGATYSFPLIIYYIG